MVTALNQLRVNLDLERLKGWVQAEISRVGSQNKLAAMLGLKHQTLMKWKNGNLKKGLDDSSIAAIARYRGESPHQTRLWLEGREVNAPHPLVQAIQDAPIEIVFEVLETGFKRAKAYASTVDKSADSRIAIVPSAYNNHPDVEVVMNVGKGRGAVGRLIRAEMKVRNLDPYLEADFREFVRCLPSVEVEEIDYTRDIVQGRVALVNDDLLGAIALALRGFTGNERYSAIYIAELNTPCPQDQHNGVTG